MKHQLCRAFCILSMFGLIAVILLYRLKSDNVHAFSWIKNMATGIHSNDIIEVDRNQTRVVRIFPTRTSSNCTAADSNGCAMKLKNAGKIQSGGKSKMSPTVDVKFKKPENSTDMPESVKLVLRLKPSEGNTKSETVPDEWTKVAPLSKLGKHYIYLNNSKYNLNVENTEKPAHTSDTLYRSTDKAGLGSHKKSSKITNKLKHVMDIVNTSRSQDRLNTSTFVLEKKNGTGLLVYDCSKSNKEPCGGWSDRLSGIVSTLVLALLTDRTFKINFDSPCALSEYLRPNKYDWTYDPSDIKNKSTSFHILTNILYHKMGKELTPKGLQKYFTSDVCFIRMNWDLTRQFRQYPNIQHIAPWITQLHFADIYHHVFYNLFKPSEEIVRNLTNIRKNASRNKTACAHLRIGTNPSMPHDLHRTNMKSLDTVWSFLDQLDLDVYDIFIATDDDNVRKVAKNKFKNNIIDIPGRIMHIDQTRYKKDGVCDGFRKQILDFLFLRSCDVLVLSNSGFGIMAAYLRTHDTGLYCWIDNSIVPCSRYTVHDFYPKPILAQD